MNGDVSITDSEGNTIVYNPETESYEPTTESTNQEGGEDTGSDSEPSESTQEPAKQSTPDYPDDWDKRRRQVYKRDNYECINCQRSGGPYGDIELHAHHVVPRSAGGVHELTNLITVCEPCHKAIHSPDVMAPSAVPESKRREIIGTASEITREVKDAHRNYRRIKRIFRLFS